MSLRSGPSKAAGMALIVLVGLLNFPYRGAARDGVGLRERCLWLRYETAARANEELSLNADDEDLANKRAVVVSKGVQSPANVPSGPARG